MKFLLVVLMLAVSGCSSTWESSEAVSTRSNGEKKQIIATSADSAGRLNGDEVFLLVYRESGFIGSATAWPVQYNGEKIGSLKNGTFIAIKTNAGPKNLTPESHLGIYSEGVEAFTLNAKAGQTYYLKHGPDSIYTSRVKIRETEPTKASAEVAKYALVKVINDYSKSATNSAGRIAAIKGRAFIERGIKTLPAKVGSQVYVDDKVNVQEGSQVSILLFGSGLIKITEKTSFQIPETRKAGPPPGMATKAWSAIKKLINGESFELKGTSSTGGVRG